MITQPHQLYRCTNAARWSADGKSIAYFDESGEYELHIRSQDGGEVRKINPGQVLRGSGLSPTAENLLPTIH